MAIQDADNRSWKLALVLGGMAADRLLDSDEAKRRSMTESELAYMWESHLQSTHAHLPGARGLDR